MKAWKLTSPGPVESGPLRLVEAEVPAPVGHQVRVQVRACAVCRTDLHVVEGDLPVHRPGIIPGHQVVGIVDALGANVTTLRTGDRVGIAWLAHTCGACRFCRRGAENLCPNALFNGWDLDGGYAEFVLGDERYAYRLPDDGGDEELAPLLCAGIIGYRALKRAELPPGGRLGIYGFGSSAHITAQIAIASGAEVFVFTRSAEAGELAQQLGAAHVSGAQEASPAPLDAAILFAPVGELVLRALEALDRGGTLAIAGIHLSDVPVLKYQDHLFYERQIRSVTANTRSDGEELLALAPRLGIRVATTAYHLDDAAGALAGLKNDKIRGSAVLVLR